MGKLVQDRLRGCKLRETVLPSGFIGGQYTSTRDSKLKVFSRWKQHSKDLGVRLHAETSEVDHFFMDIGDLQTLCLELVTDKQLPQPCMMILTIMTMYGGRMYIWRRL